jgi:hypothetical protein
MTMRETINEREQLKIPETLNMQPRDTMEFFRMCKAYDLGRDQWDHFIAITEMNMRNLKIMSQRDSLPFPFPVTETTGKRPLTIKEINEAPLK